MKVRVKATDKIVEAKRLKDLTKEEMQESIGQNSLEEDGTWDLSDGDKIFIPTQGNNNEWLYMFDSEIDIIEGVTEYVA